MRRMASRVAAYAPLPVLLGLTLGLRVLWALLIPVDPVSDPAAYDTFARNIAEHGVYGFSPETPGAFWAVGAAAIYAGAYLVFGTGGLAVVIVNLLSALLSVWGLWDLGRRWFAETVGRLAALLFALWPLSIQFTTLLASEIHFIALTLLGLMAWDRAGAPGWRGWIMVLLAGAALAGATYVRPVALLIPAALVVAILFRTPRRVLAPALRAVVVTALIFACVAPWSARNERVFGEPVFMSTNFWPNFWMGNNPESNGEYMPMPDEVRGMGEIERSDYLKARSLETLKADPGGFVVNTLLKAVRLHQRETIGAVWNARGIEAIAGPGGVTAVKLASTGYWYLLLLGGLAGIVVLARHRGAWTALLTPPVWLWLYFVAIHAIIVVGDRYHMPSVPFIALLAAVALSGITRPEPRSPTPEPQKG